MRSSSRKTPRRGLSLRGRTRATAKPAPEQVQHATPVKNAKQPDKQVKKQVRRRPLAGVGGAVRRTVSAPLAAAHRLSDSSRLSHFAQTTIVGTGALAVLVSGSVAAANHSDRRSEPGPADIITADNGDITPVTPPVQVSPPTPRPAATPDRQSVVQPATLGPLAARVPADVVVTAEGTLTEQAVEALTALAPGGKALLFNAGRVVSLGKSVPVAAVDPGQFRQFAAEGTAEATGVWDALVRGELVVSHDAAETLGIALGDTVEVAPLAGGAAIPLRVAALATTGLPGTEYVISAEIGARLGIPVGSAIILAGPSGMDSTPIVAGARKLVGDNASVDWLTPPDTPIATLKGSAAAKAFGAFNYRYYSDGTIAPDPAWVRANIRTEVVPILGKVTCHQIMLRQLRAALAELEARGLSDLLTTYDGCYVPRFIARDPGRAISLHTWGIAIDMDAATNYRGIRGTMDIRVVEIFKKWGFSWGGDWAFTDPMHFQLNRIVATPYD